jgi:hypothetical protein
LKKKQVNGDAYVFPMGKGYVSISGLEIKKSKDLPALFKKKILDVIG